MIVNFDHIEGLIDKKYRQRFIKKIFKGNSIQYSTFIEDLEAIPNWKEAYEYIETEFTKRNINITKNNEAIAFTDIVFKKHFPLYHL